MMTQTLPTARFWLDRPVLVTGATGLVGGWLVHRLLHAGADVVCLVRDSVPQSMLYRQGLDQHLRTVRGDVGDQRLLERALGEYQIHTVLHLAAQAADQVAHHNPLSTFESNIAGAWTMLEACRRTPTVEQVVLGLAAPLDAPLQAPADSGSRRRKSRHPRDVSHSCADLIGQAYAYSYDLPVAMLRCGSVFGSGDLNWQRLVPGAIRALLRGESPRVDGPAHTPRDWLYVEDAVSACLRLVEVLTVMPEIRGHAFNFAADQALSPCELGRTLARLMHVTVEPVVDAAAPVAAHSTRLSTAKSRKLLQWKPQHETAAALATTIDWYRQLFTGQPTGTVSFVRPQWYVDPLSRSA